MSENITFNFLKIFLALSLAWIIIYCFIILSYTSELKNVIFDPMKINITEYDIDVIKKTSLIFIILNSIFLGFFILWFIIRYFSRNGLPF